MNIESELAELDQKEYQKLKRAIARNKSELRGLSEKQKLKLLAGWIDDIKEEREKKAEEPEEQEEYDIDAEDISAKEEKVIEAAESDEKIPEIEVIEDEEASEGKKSWFKAALGVFIILLVIAACVIGTLYLLRDTGELKFEKISDKTVDENKPVDIEFKTKNADGIDIYNMPNGSKFEDTTFVWTPTYEQAGIYNITATAYNNESNKTQTFKIKVNNVNRAPRIIYTSPPPQIGVYTGKKVHFKAIAEDADKDPLTYTWYLGSEKYIGTSEINMTFAVPGDKIVKVSACDKEGCASHAWNVKVVSYAPKAQTKTYVISEITVKNETVAKEEGGEGAMTTYSVSDSGNEEVVIVPNAESSENRLNKYILYE